MNLLRFINLLIIMTSIILTSCQSYSPIYLGQPRRYIMNPLMAAPERRIIQKYLDDFMEAAKVKNAELFQDNDLCIFPTQLNLMQSAMTPEFREWAWLYELRYRLRIIPDHKGVSYERGGWKLRCMLFDNIFAEKSLTGNPALVIVDWNVKYSKLILCGDLRLLNNNNICFAIPSGLYVSLEINGDDVNSSCEVRSILNSFERYVIDMPARE